MKYQQLKNSGFTLIELLVVIAIIGILASTVLASMASSRSSALDAGVLSEMRQMATVLELTRNSGGSYLPLNNYGWVHVTSECDARFSGPFVTKARELCKSIVGKNSRGAGGFSFVIGIDPAFSSSTQYSIIAWLPGKQRYACLGSGGQQSATSPNETALWVGPGCWSNP